MRLSRRSLLAAASGAAVTAVATLARVARGADDGIEGAMDREARRLGHPGLALAVVSRDAPPVLRAHGVRDTRGKDPVRADTIFRIASVTKVLSGIALLQLRDAGALGLDDPVARWLPESGLPATMTLRHLFTHTSGLPRNVPAGAVTEQALVAAVARAGRLFAPGSRTAYSNLGMALAGPIVRRAGGVPYRDWMRDHVLGPLGMSGAGWERASLPTDRVATGNLVVHDGSHTRFEPSLSEWRMGAAESFGGLYASLDDMVRFARFELGGATSSPSPLSAASLRESQTPALEIPGERVRYGVCWRIEGSRLVHGGATDEYACAVVLDPARRAGVVVLSTAPLEPEVEACAKRLLERAIQP